MDLHTAGHRRGVVAAPHTAAVEANPAGDLYPAVYVRKDNVVTEHLLPSSPLLDFETAEHRKQLGDALRPLGV